ncbi:MAG: AraC family transcriptional regulator, partial [Halieaceae bacterium]|nr:AraC family transcriptional regulator [Halieaceae bacterium]
MYRVAALLYPQALTTSITLPLEILTAAAQIAQVKSRLNAGVTVSLAAADAAPVSLFGGITLTPDINYRALPPLDLLIVPAVWRNPRPVVKAAGPLLSELIRVASEGTRVCAVGTGACLLAEAGLLDGRPATTHWNYLDRFATDYPK